MAQFCVVVCGRLPGGSDDLTVWAPIAKAFQMNVDAFAQRVLPRMPLMVKQGMDEPVAQGMVDRMRTLGIDAIACPDDGQRVVFERAGTLKGPVPLICLSQFIEPGARYRNQDAEQWSVWPDSAELLELVEFSPAFDDTVHIESKPSPSSSSSSSGPAPVSVAAAAPEPVPVVAQPPQVTVTAPQFFDGPVLRPRTRTTNVRPNRLWRIVTVLVLLIGAAGGAAYTTGYWPTVVHCVRDGACAKTGPYPTPQTFAQRWNVSPLTHNVQDDSALMKIETWHTCSSVTGDRCLVARICAGHGTIVATKRAAGGAYDYAVSVNQLYALGLSPDEGPTCSTGLMRAVNALYDSPPEVKKALMASVDGHGSVSQVVNGVKVDESQFKSPAGTVTFTSPNGGGGDVSAWRRFAAQHSWTMLITSSGDADARN